MTNDILSFPKIRRPGVEVTLWEAQRGRPQEDVLLAELTCQGYQALPWEVEPNQNYLPHAHVYAETLWVVRGTITLVLPIDRRMLELMPGDRVLVPPGTLHTTFAGPEGARYLVATRLTGTVAVVLRSGARLSL